MGTRGEGQGIDSLITLWGESVPVFTVTGDIDPFLHVSLRKGEKIYCESIRCHGHDGGHPRPQRQDEWWFRPGPG
jgi:hypothetical protein